MKTYKQKLAAALLTVLISAASVLSAVPVYAAGGSISLVANKATVSAGGSLIVAIYMNGGGNAVYGVQTDISYPSSKLQYVGFSGSGSAFEISATNGGSDGLASIARGTVNPVSGSALVGTATFKAIATSGSAAIAIASSSSLADGNGAAVPYVPGSVTVAFGAAPAAVSAPSAPAAPAAPEPPKDTTAPTITAVHVKSKTPYSAVVTWSTNEPASSALDYGVDSNYGLSASQAGLATAHEVTIASSFLAPKSIIHYRIKTADEAGNVQTGSDQSLQLPGVPISFLVRGEDGQPEANALVSVDNQTATTDAKGQATLQTSLGSKQVLISYAGVTVSRPIVVARAAKPLPPFRLDLAKKPLNHWMLTSIGLSIVVLTLLGLDAMLFGSTFIMKLIRWRHKDAAVVASSNVAAAVPVAAPMDEPQTIHTAELVTAPSLSVAEPASAPTDVLPATAPSINIPVGDEPESETELPSQAAVVAERLRPRAKTHATVTHKKPATSKNPTIKKSTTL